MALRVLQEIAAGHAGHDRLARACRCCTGTGCSTRRAWRSTAGSLGFVAKQFLAGDGIHYEPRWFKPWPAGRRATRRRSKAATIRSATSIFDCGGVRIGFEICEDAWVANRPGGDLSLHGVDVILNPSASHFAFGKIEVRQRFVLEGSRAFGVSYVYANLLGNEAGRAIYDGGALIASGGKLLGRRAAVLVRRLATDHRA